jgi:hypothetical protein
VIRIRAEDSPNVRLGLAQKSRGQTPTNEILVPGVLSWEEYDKRRKRWDKVQQTVSLDGMFFKGSEVYLFPSEVLTKAVQVAAKYQDDRRRAVAMGVDAAEGGDDTVWSVIDYLGMFYQKSIKTGDTADITGITKALIREYQLTPDQVIFDRGGGGKQHADRLRRDGFDVRTVGFGESPTDPHKERKTSTVKSPVQERVVRTETAYAYKNRRAEMYALTAELFARLGGFGIPSQYSETLRQLKVLRKQYNGEGRLYLPPKDKPHPGYTGETIRAMIGRSPDQADSLVLAVYGMVRRPVRVLAGAM